VALVVELMPGIGAVAALLTRTTAYAHRRQPSAPDRLNNTHIGART
jgi:hypothetical protein